MTDPIQDLHDHVDRRFGEMHTSLEGLRTDIRAIRDGQLDHIEAHVSLNSPSSKTQATGIAAVVAAVVAALSQVFANRLGV